MQDGRIPDTPVSPGSAFLFRAVPSSPAIDSYRPVPPNGTGRTDLPPVLLLARPADFLGGLPGLSPGAPQRILSLPGDLVGHAFVVQFRIVREVSGSLLD